MGEYEVHQIRIQRPYIDLFVQAEDCKYSIKGKHPPQVNINCREYQFFHNHFKLKCYDF